LQFLTFADRGQATPLGWVSRDTAENRLPQQHVTHQAGVVEVFSSLKEAFIGTGHSIDWCAWVAAWLIGLR